MLRLRGSVPVEHTLARRGALRLWELLKQDEPVRALGAVTGNQAMQMVRAGLQAIYLSGWQAAADANTAGAMYPDQSLYPANTGPELARKINRTLQRADQIEHQEGGAKRDWFAPIVADAEAGFGGPLNCFEIMKAYIEAGVAGVHFEDQLASEKKCGHLGGKVLIPTQAAVRNLDAARLAADVCGVPTLLVARTDAESARLITSDVDERDREFLTGERTPEGFFRLREGSGLDHCIKRGLAFAPHADLLWWETSHPDLDDARTFAEAVHKQYPGKLLAYNCSPSFNWAAKLDADTIAKFQRELGAMGYKFQFVTLAGFHSLNHAMFELASAATATAAWRLIPSFSKPSSPPKPTATPRPATSARSAPAISMRSPPPSRPDRHRPRRSRNRPKPRNSRTPEARRTSWDSVIGSSAANIATASSMRSCRVRKKFPDRSPMRPGRGPNGSG